MGWLKDTHIHVHVDNDKVVCLLKEIRDALKGGDKVKELEAQMDSWLIGLNEAFSTLEKVSETVDSKNKFSI